MLVACYFFDWKPFGIFISYLIEIVVLLLFYSLFRVKDEKKNPEQYRKAQPLVNLFIGLVPLILFQYFIIGWTSGFINPEQNFSQQNLLLTKEVFYAFGSVVVLYAIKAVQITNHKERLIVFQDNFLFKVLALTGANSLGFVMVVGIGVDALLPTLTVTVIVRIFLEIYFSRKMKFI
jgi:hypothetical protein